MEEQCSAPDVTAKQWEREERNGTGTPPTFADLCRPLATFGDLCRPLPTFASLPGGAPQARRGAKRPAAVSLPFFIPSKIAPWLYLFLEVIHE